MPQSKKKAASGAGSIRKVTKTRNGKQYTYWEARFTTGYDPGTGKQIQKTISGKTQKDVAERLRTITNEIDRGVYIEPCRMTLGEWLDIWEENYLGDVKPYTVVSYRGVIRQHIRPALGGLPLDEIPPHVIQMFYNSLTRGSRDKKPLCAKTVKNVHKIFC